MELCNDILKIITVSSAKMYGKRGDKNKKQKALEKQLAESEIENA